MIPRGLEARAVRHSILRFCPSRCLPRIWSSRVRVAEVMVQLSEVKGGGVVAVVVVAVVDVVVAVVVVVTVAVSGNGGLEAKAVRTPRPPPIGRPTCSMEGPACPRPGARSRPPGPASPTGGNRPSRAPSGYPPALVEGAKWTARAREAQSRSRQHGRHACIARLASFSGPSIF